MPYTDIPNFAQLSANTASSVESVMDSLYRTETAVISAPGSNGSKMRKRFETLKGPMRDEWEGIIAFFRSCHGFDEYLHVIIASLDSSSYDHAACDRLLVELTSEARIRLEESKQLSSRHALASKGFYDSEPLFRRVLERHASLWSRWKGMPLRSSSLNSRRPGASQTSASPISSQQITIIAQDDRSRAFIDASLSATRPDGLLALSNSHSALMELGISLEKIEAFWAALCDNSDLFLKSFRSSRDPRSIVAQARSFSDNWKAYQVALDKAIASISQSRDAACVVPPSVPTQTGSTGRQEGIGSAEFTTAIHSLAGVHGAGTHCCCVIC